MNPSPLHLPKPPPPSTITTTTSASPSKPQCTTTSSSSSKSWQCHHNNLNFSHDYSHLYGSATTRYQHATSSQQQCSSHPTSQITPTADDGTHQQQLAPTVQIWYCVHFMRLCQICLAMPLIGLVACLLIAVIFQFGDIQETACKVRYY